MLWLYIESLLKNGINCRQKAVAIQDFIGLQLLYEDS
jgi:hypothetical protein